MKIFITGTESFVGRELIAQCKKQNVEVCGCDAVQPADTLFKKADICSKEIASIIPENVDAIIHLAALSTDPQCRDKANECFATNVMGTINLMNAAKEKNAKQFIFSSSEWVYDSFTANEVKTEDSIINIANIKSEYALSKLVSEANLRQKFQHGFCPVTILRFGIIYGPRKGNWSAVEALFNDVKTKDSITVGSLKTGRCFIHVSDIAAGIIKAIGQTGFEIINLQGEKLVTLGEIIETSKKIVHKSPQISEKDHDNLSIRPVSNARAKEKLQWKPEVDIEIGLKSLLS